MKVKSPFALARESNCKLGFEGQSRNESDVILAMRVGVTRLSLHAPSGKEVATLERDRDEWVLRMGRRYLKAGQKAPEGYEEKEGTRGGRYYETKSRTSGGKKPTSSSGKRKKGSKVTSPKPEDETMRVKTKKGVDIDDNLIVSQSMIHALRELDGDVVSQLASKFAGYHGDNPAEAIYKELAQREPVGTDSDDFELVLETEEETAERQQKEDAEKERKRGGSTQPENNIPSLDGLTYSATNAGMPTVVRQLKSAEGVDDLLMAMSSIDTTALDMNYRKLGLVNNEALRTLVQRYYDSVDFPIKESWDRDKAFARRRVDAVVSALRSTKENIHDGMGGAINPSWLATLYEDMFDYAVDVIEKELF